jgi:hypothetical protein
MWRLQARRYPRRVLKGSKSFARKDVVIYWENIEIHLLDLQYMSAFGTNVR